MKNTSLIPTSPAIPVAPEPVIPDSLDEAKAAAKVASDAIRYHHNKTVPLDDKTYQEHLRTLLGIMAKLNRTTAGPKKEPRKAAAQKKAKAGPPSLEDLL